MMTDFFVDNPFKGQHDILCLCSCFVYLSIFPFDNTTAYSGESYFCFKIALATVKDKT